MNVYRSRCHMAKDAGADSYPIGAKLSQPAIVADIMHRLYDDAPSEVFVVFHLNIKNAVVGFEEIHRGTLDASLVHARDILRSAILSNAGAIILAHNHPSGSLSPSPEDRAVTRQVAAAAKLVGVPLLDHVIIGAMSEGFVSLGPDGDGDL